MGSKRFWTCLILALAFAGPSPAQTVLLPNMNMETPLKSGAIPEWNTTPPVGSYRVSRDPVAPFEGVASARIEFVGTPIDSAQFGTIVRSIDATPYRGKRIRFHAAVRTEILGTAWVGLWMRVDTSSGSGFFDNMQDRPIRTADWKSFEITGDIAPDAKTIAFGMLLSGGGKAWLDDASLTIVGDAPPPSASAGRTTTQILSSRGPVRAGAIEGDTPPRPFTPRGLTNITALARAYGYLAHFDATDQAAEADWPLVAIQAVNQVEPSKDSVALARSLNAALRPYAPDFCAYPAGGRATCAALKPVTAVGALAWRHEGRGIASDSIYKSERVHIDGVSPDRLLTVELGGGVAARVAIAAWVDAHGKTLAPAAGPASVLAKPAGWAPDGFDRSTRIADAIVAWNLFQHFYPYFDVVKVDWPAVLQRSLVAAANDADDKAFERTLGHMINALEDGHGIILYTPRPKGHLPLTWDWVGGKLVVTAVADHGADMLRPGDTIDLIDGEPASSRVGEAMETFSGTIWWRRWRALDRLLYGAPAQAMSLSWSRPGKAGVAKLVFGTSFEEARPAQLSEVRPGILYVDLAHAFDGDSDRLTAAKAIIFDVRGYPSVPPDFLAHLSAAPFKSMPMRIPIVTRPDRRGWTWDETEWNIDPVAPRFTGQIVFLTDERAASYAESILQTVKGARLGLIVGSRTAGVNGNINPFMLPGGYTIIWTGMQVLNSDRSVHHNVGVIPDITASRTIAGIRAGRDEVLEKGIEILEHKGR